MRRVILLTRIVISDAFGALVATIIVIAIAHNHVVFFEGVNQVVERIR